MTIKKIGKKWFYLFGYSLLKYINTYMVWSTVADFWFPTDISLHECSPVWIEFISFFHIRWFCSSSFKLRFWFSMFDHFMLIADFSSYFNPKIAVSLPRPSPVWTLLVWLWYDKSLLLAQILETAILPIDAFNEPIIYRYIECRFLCYKPIVVDWNYEAIAYDM